ncbi:hypothetical protein [Desulfallas thermosapovorans]|nr:hypothetical protein [Desulfallas thermosapovorans]
MRLFISRDGLCFSGKVRELRKIIRPWSQSSATLREFITSALH